MGILQQGKFRMTARHFARRHKRSAHKAGAAVLCVQYEDDWEDSTTLDGTESGAGCFWRVRN